MAKEVDRSKLSEVILKIPDYIYEDMYTFFRNDDALYKRVDNFIKSGEVDCHPVTGYTLHWYGVNWHSHVPMNITKFLNTLDKIEYKITIYDMDGYLVREKGEFAGFTYRNVY